MKVKLFNILFYIMLFGAPATTAASASDLEKEKRWSSQIVEALLDGEAVNLKAGDTGFLGIYTEADDPAGRAVILMHGIGVHPDWPEVINPLRSALPAHGWSTLSIQMPVLANDAGVEDYVPLFDEVPARVDAAIAYLRERGNKTIILVGHSLGAAMGAYYLAGKDKTGVEGFVAVGMMVNTSDDKLNSAMALEKITLPVLDIYGSRDLDAVRASAGTREKAAQKAGNAKYRQLQIEGADHFFLGSEDILVRRVYGWLKSGFGDKQS